MLAITNTGLRYILIVVFLAQSIGWAVPCFCGLVDKSHSHSDVKTCCHESQADVTFWRSVCCQDEDQQTAELVLPEPPTGFEQVASLLPDRVLIAVDEREIDTAPVADQLPSPLLLTGSTPDLRAPPAWLS